MSDTLSECESASTVTILSIEDCGGISNDNEPQDPLSHTMRDIDLLYNQVPVHTTGAANNTIQSFMPDALSECESASTITINK